MAKLRRKAILSPLAVIIWIIVFGVGIAGGAMFFGGEGILGGINLQKGLVAQWKFAGNAKDATPNSNDGTVTGAGLIVDRKGTINQAYNFNGTTDVITVADSSSLDITGTVTVGGWMYDPPLEKSQVHLSPDGENSKSQIDSNPPAGEERKNSYLTEEVKHKFHKELAKQPIGTKRRISPYSMITNLGNGKFRAEFSTLQMTKEDLSPIDSTWHKQGNQWIAGENLFRAQIDGNKVYIAADSDIPETKIKAGDDVTFSPRLYIGGKEYKAKGAPKLLAKDPINDNYSSNVLEWDYGVAKRRLRIIEGYIQGSWIFAKDPRAEVRIKYNQSGKLALSLGGSSTIAPLGVTPLRVVVVDNDEEVVKSEQFAQTKSYPVSIGDVSSFTSMTADAGYWGTSATYATARSAGTSLSSTATNATVGQYCVPNPPYACSSYTVYRGGLQWDTSTLSDTAVISAGVIYLYPYSDTSTTDFTITIVNGSGLSDTPVTGDHDNLNSAATRTAAYNTASGWSGAAYKTFSGLDATGISEISKTGRTKFGVRSSLDMSSTLPTGNEYVAFYTNEGGSGKEPKIDVTYVDLPGITTSAASSITSTTARLNGNVTATNGENPTVTVYWGDNDGGTTAGNWDNNSAPTSPGQPQGIAAFYKDVTGLTTNTTYYFTAKAVNSAGTTWATTQYFTTSSTSSSVVIIGKNRDAYNLEIDSSLNLKGYISGSASGTYQITKTWHHVVMTYDGVNIKIYVDGVLRITTAKTGAIGTNPAPLLMGSSLPGKLDDMRVYSRALGQNEITAWYDEYNNPGIAVSGLQKGLIGHWKFNGNMKSATPNGSNGSTCASGHIDNGNGTCTATFYPDAHPESTSYDGWCSTVASQGSSWATVHDTLVSPLCNDNADAGGYLYAVVDNRYAYHKEIDRSIILFDTSSLPDSSTISSATLSLRIRWGVQSTRTATVKANIYASTPAYNDHIVTADYTGAFTLTADTEFSTSKSVASLHQDDGSYDDWALNASGLTAISKTGVSKFAWRDADNDAANSATGAQDAVMAGAAAYSSDSGTGYKPKLVVTYTLSGPTLTTDRKGTANQAYSFNGTSDYIAIPAINGLSTTQTISMWIKPTSFSAGMNQYLIDEGSNIYQIQLYDADDNDGLPKITFNGQLGASELPTANAWYHVIAIARPSGANSIYINGNLDSSPSVENKTPSTINIGRYGGASNYFNGSIDDVRIYSRALNQTEITSLYSEYNNPGIAVSDLQKGLVGNWRMDGNAKDNTPYANDGTVNNGAILATDRKGAANKTYSFNGSAYIDVGSSSVIKPTAAITLAAWIYPTTLSGAHRFFDNFGPGGAGYTGWCLYVSGTGLGFQIYAGGSESDTGASYSFSVNNWYHIVTTYDGAYTRTYVNGVLQGTPYAKTGAIGYASTPNVRIGNSTNYPGQPFYGKIDDARIYNRALSQAEITALYQSY